MCNDRRECCGLRSVCAKSVMCVLMIERSWKRWHVMRIVSGAPDVYLCQLERRRVALKNMLVASFLQALKLQDSSRPVR